VKGMKGVNGIVTATCQVWLRKVTVCDEFNENLLQLQVRSDLSKGFGFSV